MPIIDELKKPANVIGIVLAIVGILSGAITGLYFYRKGEKVGEMAMYVEQIQVIDKTKLGETPLKILDKSGNPIKDNVYVASITIWNYGNAEIKQEDVRRPYRISMIDPDFGGGDNVSKNDHEIIELSPTFFSRGNLDHFLVDQSGNISWGHFDPGEGFKIRIIYVGTRLHKIYLDGYAVGIGEVLDSQKQQEKIVQFPRVQSFYGVMGALLIITLGLIWFRRAIPTIKMQRITISLDLITILAVAGLTVWVFSSTASVARPPF
jgi:hypothetical protein